MKAFYMIIGGAFIVLLGTAMIAMGADTTTKNKQEGTQPLSLANARMNVVFLDDGAEGLPAGVAVRYNHWPEWDARMPTFQKLLYTFIADFHKAKGQQPAAEASLYAMEVLAGTTAAERDQLIAEYLAEIAKVTGRATLVLARSTAGADQLRLVYVLDNDCPPRQAASFLAALAEVDPPVFHGRIGERFGPFRAPPTIVFDPRANVFAPVIANEKARHRWALLEEDAYLLPHYVLHMVAALHEATPTELAALRADRTIEPGNLSMLEEIRSKLEQAQVQRAEGGWINNFKAWRNENEAVKLAAIVAEMPNGINNLSLLGERGLAMLKPQLDRVGIDNMHGGAAELVDAAKGARDGSTVGGIITVKTGVGPIIGAGGAVVFGRIAEVGQASSDRLINLYLRVNDNYNSLLSDAIKVDSQKNGAIGELSGGGSDLFRSINLRPTAGELQLFQQSLRESKISTFGGSGPADLNLGGILFEHDNEYFVDLSGRVAKEVAAEAHTGRAARGLMMGKLRYFDELPLLWLDVATSRDGSLPVAVSRFLTAAGADAPRSFGGPWSFEPLSLEVRRNAEGRLLRATVMPAETCTRVSYMPLDLVIKDAPPQQLTIRNGTGFEPALEVKDDGRFIWTLRHGVTIEFDADGLVEAIRSPHGEHVAYLRESGRLVGQQTADGRRIDIQYRGELPESIDLQGKRRANYKYHADYWLVEACGDHEAWTIGYAPTGRPSKIASATSTLLLGHDEEGRITSVESGTFSTLIEYIKGTNTLRISTAGKPTMEWLLGPISGPVMKDRAVLLTRSMAGRILQVSKGPVEGTGSTRQFMPSETIELIR